MRVLSDGDGPTASSKSANGPFFRTHLLDGLTYSVQFTGRWAARSLLEEEEDRGGHENETGPDE